MQIVSAVLLETTTTHYIVELTIKTKKHIFAKTLEEKVKVHKQKRLRTWHAFDDREIDYKLCESLDAFISTGKETINF